VRIEKFWLKNRSLGKFLTLGLLSVVVFINLTFASNITLNTGQPIQFGQGIVLTTTCDTYLTVKLTREFDTATNSFMVKDLILGDISTKLHSKRLSLALRNDATDTLLTSSNLYFDLDASGIVFTSPLAHTDSINYTSTSAYGANEIGTSSITFTNIRKTDNSKIPADDVSRVLFESSKGGGCTAPTISCANGGTCSVGDTGPGGGPVIYVSATPITLRSAGKTVTRIEMAPNTWIGVTYATDPNIAMCQAYNGGGPLWTGSRPGGWLGYSNVSLPTGLGYGLENTNKLLSFNSSNVSCAEAGQAASVARNYSGGGLNDWFLPSLDELNIVCRYANTLSMTSTAICTSGTVRGGFLDTPNSSWWSSSIYDNQLNYVIRIRGADGTYRFSTQSNTASVRPIRMF
jgi:hypothetical protein